MEDDRKNWRKTMPSTKKTWRKAHPEKTEQKDLLSQHTTSEKTSQAGAEKKVDKITQQEIIAKVNAEIERDCFVYLREALINIKDKEKVASAKNILAKIDAFQTVEIRMEQNKIDAAKKEKPDSQASLLEIVKKIDDAEIKKAIANYKQNEARACIEFLERVEKRFPSGLSATMVEKYPFDIDLNRSPINSEISNRILAAEGRQNTFIEVIKNIFITKDKLVDDASNRSALADIGETLYVEKIAAEKQKRNEAIGKINFHGGTIDDPDQGDVLNELVKKIETHSGMGKEGPRLFTSHQFGDERIKSLYSYLYKERANPEVANIYEMVGKKLKEFVEDKKTPQNDFIIELNKMVNEREELKQTPKKG